MLGAPVLHGPVLRGDLMPSLARPLDLGLSVRGRRVFGDNKTWRGALVMGAGTVGASLALDRAGWFRSRLPAPLREAGPWRYGPLLALGVVGGELPNSFLKRRLGIAPGSRRWTPAGVALVVFDLVGTTVASDDAVPRAFTEALAGEGVTLDTAAIAAVRGATKRDALLRLLPPGAEGLSSGGFAELAGWAGRMFEAATMVALPAATALLVAGVSMGLIARSAPQLNIFSVGFPLTLMLGIVALLFSLPLLAPQFGQLMQAALDSGRSVVEAFR